MAAAIPSAALAKETDQYTDRVLLLRLFRHGHRLGQGVMEPEAVDRVLDREMTKLLRRLERRLNESSARTAAERRASVRAVFQHRFTPELITPYEEWIVSEALVPVYFTEHRGIFGHDVDFDDMRLAWWVQLAPTVMIDGVLMGVDKPGHFIGQGFQYFVEYESLEPSMPLQRRLEHVKRFGYETEMGKLGVATGGVFSYADLASNWEGFLFHLCLFDDVAIAGDRHSRFFSVDSAGRYRLQRSFTWSEWVTADWDEVLNPNSVAGKDFYDKIVHALRTRRHGGESVCDSYRRSPSAFLGSSAPLLDRRRYSAPAPAPVRLYPIVLTDICAR